VCVAALSILLFNEGISYTEMSKTESEEVIEKAPSDLYIISDHKVSDLHYDKEISFDDEDYNVYFIDDNKGLFISSRLVIDNSYDNLMKIKVTKRSAGRSRTDAIRKAGSLLYNYRITGDTLYLDEYFTMPAGTKWSFDNVRVSIYIPEGTEVHFDRTTENMLRRHYSGDWFFDSDDKEYVRSGSRDYYWVMTEDGLRRRSYRDENTR
jgi:hypothetical protein